MSKTIIDLSQMHPVVRFVVSLAVIGAAVALVVLLLPVIFGVIAVMVVLGLIAAAWFSYAAKKHRTGFSYEQRSDGTYHYQQWRNGERVQETSGFVRDPERATTASQLRIEDVEVLQDVGPASSKTSHAASSTERSTSQMSAEEAAALKRSRDSLSSVDDIEVLDPHETKEAGK